MNIRQKYFIKEPNVLWYVLNSALLSLIIVWHPVFCILCHSWNIFESVSLYTWSDNDLIINFRSKTALSQQAVFLEIIPYVMQQNEPISCGKRNESRMKIYDKDQTKRAHLELDWPFAYDIQCERVLHILSNHILKDTIPDHALAQYIWSGQLYNFARAQQYRTLSIQRETNCQPDMLTTCSS